MRHHIVRRMPQQNGVAKHINMTLIQRVHCILSTVGLRKEFWAKAISIVCFLVNRSPFTAIKCKTPKELWYDTLTYYSSFKVFSFLTYAHVNEDKLEPRAKKCIFLGYGSRVKGYRLGYPILKSPKFFISRDATFNESIMLTPRKKNVDIDRDHGVSEQLELQCDITWKKQDDTLIQSIEKKMQDFIEEDDVQEE